MVNDVHVGAEGEALETCDDAQRFCVERIGTPDGFLEDARENNLSVGGSVFEGLETTAGERSCSY